jgi:hypothetical protein
MSPPFFARWLFLSVLATFGYTAECAELIRGPYLQMGTPTGVTVRWRTDEPTESIVRYGVASDNLHLVASHPELKTEHVVKLSGLNAATRYFYSVGDLSENFAGPAGCFFHTSPPAGIHKPTRVWVIGDCGTFNTGAGNQVGVRDAYYAYSADRHTDVWLALGDNAYFSGTDAEYQANFFNIYPTLLRQSVLWSTIGNHETYAVPAGEQIPYLDMFTFPTSGEAGGVASGTEKYYSFNHANIHFVCLDSELSDRTLQGPMLTWLRADLEANTSDWLIAFWHSPPYSKGSHDSDNLADNFGNMRDMRVNAVQLLESHGVDLVLSGHSHIYERSYLLNGHYGTADTLTPVMLKDAGSGRPGDTGPYLKPGTGPAANQGAVYIVAGSSGWATSRTGFHPAMFFDELQTGSLVLDVHGHRLDAKFLRETGAIDDFFTIIKGATPEPLRICTFAIRDGETVVRWKSVAGEDYVIERSPRMHAPSWLPASTQITATGATSSWTAPLPHGEQESFYRVVHLPRQPQPAPARTVPTLKSPELRPRIPIRTLRNGPPSAKRPR